MNTTANPAPAVDAIMHAKKLDADIHTLAWKQTLLLALGAVASFHLAYIFPSLSCLVVVYLYCLYRLAELPTPRKAFYFGLAIGYAVYAPHLTFFWTIFGWPAIALWTVLAFWLALFVVLARLCRKRFGRFAVLLVPFLWTGLEYFRSELYYLRFSWLSVGYAFSDTSLYTWLGSWGVYGIGFLLAFLSCIIGWLRRRYAVALAAVAISALALYTSFGPGPLLESPIPHVGVVGLQLEFPSENELIEGLNKTVEKHPDAEIVVVSEYSLQRAPTGEFKDWCRKTKRHLIVGGKDFISDSQFRNTVFVVDPTGEIVFRQAKSVPIQFFADGLPATEQKLWESPWGKIGFCICYDLSYRRVTDRLIKLGAQAIIVPSADEIGWGEHEHRLHARIARTRTAESRISIFRVTSSGISQLLAKDSRETAIAPFPGQGETISGRLVLGGRTGRLPLDHWLGPFSVFVTAAIILWLSVEAFFHKFSKS